jgi:hypothetical protein
MINEDEAVGTGMPKSPRLASTPMTVATLFPI